MTYIRTKLIVSMSAALALSFWAGPALAEGPEIIPIEQIKPGQKGYGLTVFRGFKIERFQVEVIDVLKNFLPKQDLFLVRIDHPVLRRTGVVGGMSGSPIYIQGKLAGALGYGWRFSKEPIAGITPIADMLRLNKMKLRGPAKTGYASTGSGSVSGRRVADRAALRALSRRDRWWRPLPDLAPAGPAAEAQLAPVTVPLNAAGFSRQAMALLRQGFAQFGFEPVQGGGTGRAEGPTQFAPGSALGVQLASGDISLASTGTVTWVGGDRVLGFGHKMFGAGEIYLPTATTKVVHTLASLARSFKIASPARPLGTLVQDRQAGVLADTGLTARTLPMKITMVLGGGKAGPANTRTYNMRLVHHRVLTPNLVRSVTLNAMNEALSDVTRVTFTVDTRVQLAGQRPFSYREHFYAAGGVPITTTLRSQGLRALRAIMQNPFSPVRVERIDVKISVSYSHDMVQITGLSLGSNVVAPGERINVRVTFRPFSGKAYQRTYPLEVPKDLDGTLLQLEVAGGAAVRRVQAEPQNLTQYLANLSSKSYSARSLVLTLKVPGQGLKLRGRVIRDLPTRVIDTLNSGTQVRAEALFKTELRTVNKDPRIIEGKKSLRLRVQRERP